ncbi:MAG: acyltransferase [Flavobacteriaceae bacterium]
MKIDYSQRIFGLDLMRAVAILFVVCSHALWVFPEANSSLFSLLRLAGVMGVEIFFVLSGFLIGRILLRLFTSEDFAPKHFLYFLVRRWFRTFPNYYLVLLINIVIVLYIGRKLPETLGLYFGFLQNSVMGMDIFFTESWSLPIEEFAYILGPLLLYLLLLPKFPVSRKKLFLAVTLFIILFFLGTKLAYHLKHGATPLEYWNIHLKAVAIYRIDAIYYGVLAAYVATFCKGFWNKYKGTFLFLSLFLFALMHFFIGKFHWSAETTPFFLNVLYLPLCSVFIAFSLPVLSTLKTTSKTLLKPITFISIISYSMYLLHYSIILQLMHYFIKMDASSIVYQLLFSVGYVLLTLLFSYFLYRGFEKPMMDLRDTPFFRKRFNASSL